MPEQSQPRSHLGEQETVVRTAERTRLSLKEHGPRRLVQVPWEHRALICRLALREVRSRYRGSILGFAWSIVAPVAMLAIYTFVFSVVFVARWDVEIGNRGEFALILFAGLIILQLFSECVGRAPGLMRESPSYIKQVVFPLEVIAFAALGSAAFHALISVLVLLFAYAILVGVPPLTALWLPVVLLPFMVLLLGCIWFLSSFGLYLQDTRHVVTAILPIFLFASPIFYPMTAIPENFRGLLYLNPLTTIIEQTRGVLLYGNPPDFLELSIYAAIVYAFAWIGFVWFMVTKRGFADVI